ncbi:Tlg2-vesicle protein [Tulasnella sp. JGI-2019a]|nr:Tlg2-vesicle protein [Tulasnella sp. JGI-2019a]KAG9002672.1 Tlg2-vesicle protein [Tulasnella sp. JGI-2019a]
MSNETASESSRCFELPKLPSIARGHINKYVARYKKAPPIIKFFVWAFLCFEVAVLSAFIFIGPKTIAQTVYDLAQSIARLRYGWLILITVIAITSFPPLIGWSISVTMCGFAYGLKGWFVATAGALIGAAISFIVLRGAFRNHIQAWSRRNKKWVALENVIRVRGLPLIILIRLSPFPPWVYSNLLFASIDTVTLWQFMMATMVYSSKLFIQVWIGSEIAVFSDGTQRDEMDTTTKIINALSILIGMLVAVAAGWITWYLTEKEIRNTPGATSEDGDSATEALEDAEADIQAPLIQSLRYQDNISMENLNSDLEHARIVVGKRPE